MHAGQLTVSPELVRALVDEQFPDWRAAPISRVPGTGTVNAIYRIGAELAARFPLEPGEAEQARRGLLGELAAARELFGRTPVPTPEPIALGEPGAGYPLPWSVQTWLPGTVAIDADPGVSAAFALDLAEFVRAVRAIDASGRTFDGVGRGGVLATHDAWLDVCFRESERLLDTAVLRAIWHDMRALPRGPAPDVMSHGDLISGNLLVANGRLAGVLDVGGFGPADPALDLVGAWHLLEAGPRRAFRERLGSADPEWQRGRAWAFQQAMGLVWYYAESNPVLSRIGRRTLDRVLADVRGSVSWDGGNECG
ncbi:aminoglycoside phosphotransferase family protein [Nocardia sp. NPDC050712]|uniref:aminoglycoside phosphotransferase family protein n=1 Tax=Nocardia sp. NPDC050712 TaxID=3155518 RepID=UPI003409811F